jgi:hypothetical protein
MPSPLPSPPPNPLPNPLPEALGDAEVRQMQSADDPDQERCHVSTCTSVVLVRHCKTHTRDRTNQSGDIKFL